MRISTIILISALVLIIISTFVGNYLESSGIITREKLGSRGVTIVMLVYFGLFCIVAFSLVPVLLRLFIAGQIKAGNGEQLIIQWLQAHELTVVYVVWVFFVSGLFTAFVLLRDGISDILR